MKRTGMILLGALAFTAQGADLSLEIHGCVPGKQVRVALYDRAQGFSEDRDGSAALQKKQVEAKSDTVQTVFSGLEPGRYAVAAFSDLNGNRRLDSNFVGKPTEPYGYSRDARNFFSAPGFEQAAFDLDEKGSMQVIHMK